MENKIKRPIIIWIAQVMLLLIFLVVFINAVFLLLVYVQVGITIGPVGVISVMLGFAMLALLAFWALANRKPYGRALSWAVLALAFVQTLLRILLQLLGIAEFSGFQRGPEVTANFVLFGIWHLMLLFLLIWLPSSRQVTVFFSPTSESISPEPPPPPSFDS